MSEPLAEWEKEMLRDEAARDEAIERAAETVYKEYARRQEDRGEPCVRWEHHEHVRSWWVGVMRAAADMGVLVLPPSGDAVEQAARALGGTEPTQVIHVHHHDIEAHAASFNEGFDEAMGLRWPVLGWLRRWLQ